MNRRISLISGFALVALLSAGAALAHRSLARAAQGLLKELQSVTAFRWVIAGGGAPSATGSGVINDTLGQPVIGPAESGNDKLGAGYWYGNLPDGDEVRCGLAGSGNYTFHTTWKVKLHVQTLGSLFCLHVQRTDGHHPAAPLELQTGRYWTITAQDSLGNPASGYSLDLTLPASITPDGQDGLCRYMGTGQDWDCAQSSFDPEAKTITRLGLTQLSVWVVGQDVVWPYGVFLPLVVKPAP